MSKTERLQQIIDQHKERIDPDLCAVFVPFQGWYLCGQQRHFGDEGDDFMGRNFNEALRWLRWLFDIKD